MAHGAEHARNAARRFDLDAVPLIIVHRQRQDAETSLARQSARDHRIEAAGKEHDGKRSIGIHRRAASGHRDGAQGAQKNGPPNEAAQVGLSAR
jgi:uncharacterized protein YigA (DUF484 family)